MQAIRLFGLICFLLGHQLYSYCENSDHFYRSFRPPSVNNTTLSSSDYQLIPFFYFQSLLLIEAEIEGQKGFLILDTGESGMVLNATYFSGWNHRNSDLKLFGLDGEVSDFAFRTLNLELYGIHWNRVPAKVFSLEHLSHAQYAPILGLMGIDLFKDFELIIDFAERQLILLPLDAEGEYTGRRVWSRPPTFTKALQSKGHLPLIDIDLFGTTIRAALDTGSELSIFDSPLKKTVKDFLIYQSSVTIHTVGKTHKDLSFFHFQELTLAGFPLPAMKTIFFDLHALNRNLRGPHLDAILGTQFFKQWKVGINTKAKRLSVWLPSDEELLVGQEKSGKKTDSKK